MIKQEFIPYEQALELKKWILETYPNNIIK